MPIFDLKTVHKNWQGLFYSIGRVYSRAGQGLCDSHRVADGLFLPGGAFGPAPWAVIWALWKAKMPSEVHLWAN
jgi:hypothetical protein